MRKHQVIRKHVHKYFLEKRARHKNDPAPWLQAITFQFQLKERFGQRGIIKYMVTGPNCSVQPSLLVKRNLNFQRYSVLQTIPRLQSTGMLLGNTEFPPAPLSPVLISPQHPIGCLMPAASERAESCQVSPGQTPRCTSAPVVSPAWELNNICHYIKACKMLLGFFYVFKDFNVSSRKYLKQLHSLRLILTICSPLGTDQ